MKDTVLNFVNFVKQEKNRFFAEIDGQVTENTSIATVATQEIPCDKKISLGDKRIVTSTLFCDVSTQVEDIDFRDIGIKMNRNNMWNPPIGTVMGLPSVLRGENHLRIQLLKYHEIEQMFQKKMVHQSTETNLEMINVQTQVDENLELEIVVTNEDGVIEAKKTPDSVAITPILDVESRKLSKHGINTIEMDILALESTSLIAVGIQYAIQDDYSDFIRLTPRGASDRLKKESSISGLFLTSVPPILMEEYSLTTLSLSNNLITFIPSWFCESCKSLTSLNLSNNLLFELPENFGNLKKLKELDLSYNQFEYLPSCIFRFPLLASLFVNNNRILQLPSEIRTNLTEFDFSFNNLVELPDDIKKWKFKCKYSNNPFLYFTIFDILPKLSQIDERKKKKEDSDDSKRLLIQKKTVVLLDFLCSERKYVQSLKKGVDFYIQPLLGYQPSDEKKGVVLMTQDDITGIVISTIEGLLRFHTGFLYKIECELRSIERNQQDVSKVNLTKILYEATEDLRKLYISYPQTYRVCMDKFRELKETVDMTMLLSKRKIPVIYGLDLETFYILPFTRLKRYEDVLRTLRKDTLTYHEDYLFMFKAIDAMSLLVQDFNFEVDKVNNHYRMMELSKKWKLDTLLKEGRLLIREGSLKTPPSKEIGQMKTSLTNQLSSKTSFSEKIKQIKGVTDISTYFTTPFSEVRLTESVVNVYLFNDMFVMEETSSLWKLLKPTVINLDQEGTEVESSVNNESEFIVHFPPKKFLIFRADDTTKRNEWFQDFWDNKNGFFIY